MLYHAGPGSELADSQRPSREGLVQPVDVTWKIGGTPPVPPEVHVVSDDIGRTSQRVAIDSAEGRERSEPARILGLGQRVQRLDRRGRVRATADTTQLIPDAPEDNRRMVVILTDELQQLVLGRG